MGEQEGRAGERTQREGMRGEGEEEGEGVEGEDIVHTFVFEFQGGKGDQTIDATQISCSYNQPVIQKEEEKVRGIRGEEEG